MATSEPARFTFRHRSSTSPTLAKKESEDLLRKW
jgi:hypothetical protein